MVGLVFGRFNVSVLPKIQFQIAQSLLNVWKLVFWFLEILRLGVRVYFVLAEGRFRLNGLQSKLFVLVSGVPCAFDIAHVDVQLLFDAG